MQGIEIEAEGSVLKYVTEAEHRKQRSSLPFIKHLYFNQILVPTSAEPYSPTVACELVRQWE